MSKPPTDLSDGILAVLTQRLPPSMLRPSPRAIQCCSAAPDDTGEVARRIERQDGAQILLARDPLRE
jgi:hypothetical protein